MVPNARPAAPPSPSPSAGRPVAAQALLLAFTLTPSVARGVAGPAPAPAAISLERDLALAVFWSLLVGWAFCGAIFLFRKRPPKAPERTRDRTAMIGLALEAAAFAVVWSRQRPPGSPFLGIGLGVEIAIGVVALALLVGSLVLTQAAVRRLGKQWSIAARLVDSHELITDGPYGLVRHPIYTGLFGMLIATGLAVSRWPFLLAGAALYWIGTVIRTHAEERLLRGAFGTAYDDYARRVPALIPWRLGARSGP